jgi:hypothetical protein
MANITLANIEIAVQSALRNTVNTPITQSKRVEVYNQVIGDLQAKYNWNPTKRIKTFDYLTGESDYSIVNELGIADFKNLWDLRFPEGENLDRNIDEYQDIDEKTFSQFHSYNAKIARLTIEERDNDPILRLLTTISTGRDVVHDCESLTSNGTWASDTTLSDATTLAVDSTISKVGSSCFKFNIDVSQSVNNYAEIATTTTLATSLDGSAIENIGHFRLWLGLHNITAANLALITSISLRWGSSSSAYWETSITPTLVASWNRLDFDWADATQTGSPDATALDYFSLRITYSSGFTDTNNIRVDEIVMLTPTEMELVYFSTYLVSASGTLQTGFTTSVVTGTEQLLFPDRYLRVFTKLALMELFPQKEKQNDDYIRVSREAETGLQDMCNDIGNEIVRENYSLRPVGHMGGRIESRQW